MATRAKNIDINKYGRIHYWLRRNFGNASKCENLNCEGKSKNFQWALIDGCEYEFVRENFHQLCVSCHAKYDTTEYKVENAKKNKLYLSKEPKNCSKCGIKIERPTKNQSYCKKCCKSAYRENIVKWEKDNKEFLKEYKRKYYLKNIKHLKEVIHQNYIDRKEKKQLIITN